MEKQPFPREVLFGTQQTGEFVPEPEAQELHCPKENTGQVAQLLLHVVDAVLTDESVVDFLSYQLTCSLRFNERPKRTSG